MLEEAQGLDSAPELFVSLLNKQQIATLHIYDLQEMVKIISYG